MGTMDAHLLAINAYSGKLIWDTTVANATDAACQLGRCYGMTHAPLVVKDRVIVGIAGGDDDSAGFGIRGFIAAFDAATGKLAWKRARPHAVSGSSRMRSITPSRMSSTRSIAETRSPYRSRSASATSQTEPIPSASTESNQSRSYVGAPIRCRNSRAHPSNAPARSTSVSSRLRSNRGSRAPYVTGSIFQQPPNRNLKVY